VNICAVVCFCTCVYLCVDMVAWRDCAASRVGFGTYQIAHRSHHDHITSASRDVRKRRWWARRCVHVILHTLICKHQSTQARSFARTLIETDGDLSSVQDEGEAEQDFDWLPRGGGAGGFLFCGMSLLYKRDTCACRR